ncbi:MAG: 4Fe-4S dicluster domain-containing protein [Ruminococcaceae bacterium]|nr:4Fe-4S dicluster domain-containing protein [Oscillospiraceae bacterium]
MNKSIITVGKDNCTGCGACYNKCPVGAITIKYDNDGFMFPELNDKCVNCGLCQSACPVLNPLDFHETPPSFAVWASDEIRMKSSSGGMFTLLAEYVIKNNGVVFGAAYTNDFKEVHHIEADNIPALDALRGSKYVQSDIKETFRNAKRRLDNGKMVLFTGCPCQIAGLYRFLGKDYDNLYTADLVCHGQNSLKAYQSFLKEFTEGKEIENVNFRDKIQYGWSTPTVVYLKNGEVKKAPWNESTWNKGFLEGVFNRENCSKCVYARAERISDITLADCWQVHRINPKFDDRKGTSLVLVNSEKGKDLFYKVKSKMKLCESVPLEILRKYNGQLNHPAPPHPSRKFFFANIDKKGYHEALKYGRGMRFDVGIVGWWFASNYGSSLTYFALGTILQKLDKQVIMIPIAKADGNPWEPEIKFTVDFLSKHFRCGKPRTFDEMDDFNKYCDSFMLGSDQMWTGGSTSLVGYTFFLDFVDKNKKKIAFSTSFGQSDFYAPDDVVETAGDFLRRFDAVSVREKSGVQVCKNRFDVKAEQVMDPVFLCTEQDYDVLCNSVNDPIDDKYLLCYILDPTPEKEEAAKAIAKREGLKIKVLLGLREHPQAKEKWHTGEILPRVSSEQFLYYIKHCSYLLTDSHHGTCFGIIYKRPYAALINAKRGATRFETVASALGLSSRLFYDPLDVDKSDRAFQPIDYDAVDAKLKPEIERANKWLINALNSPSKQNKDTIRTVIVDGKRKELGLRHRLRTMERRLAAKDQQIDELKKRLGE